MKILFSFMLLPLFSMGQTVHLKEGKITYEGSIKVGALSTTEINTRLQNSIVSIVKNEEILKDKGAQISAVRTRGEIRLKSPYHIIRKALYTIELTAKEGSYQYRIDSVSLNEKERGGKTKNRSSKELLEVMEEGGPGAIELEKILNEMDMRFQKLLAVLQNKMKS